jgi:hypothetical protein
MAHVIAHTHIKRDNKKHIYYVKAGAIWQAPRRGSKGGRKKKVVQFAAAKRMDYSRSIYFVDGRGNVAAAKRKNSSGGRRRSAGRRR